MSEAPSLQGYENRRPRPGRGLRRALGCLSLAIGLLVLMASSAAAATVTSATYDPATHTLTTQWTLNPGECSLAVVESPDNTVTEYNNELTDGNMLHPYPNCGNTSNTAEVGETPGTYYVQLEYHPANSNADVGSNVLSFTIPTAGGGGSGGNGGSGGGGGSGAGGGGGGESGSDCLATASCVVPFLRPPQVLHGTAVLLHADGTSEPLRDAHGVQGGDTIKTGSKSAARIRFDNDDDLTLGPNTSVKVVSRGNIVSSILCGVGCSVLGPAISVVGEVIWRISGGAPPLLLGGFNPYAETWPDFAGYTTAPILHEGLPSGAPGGRTSDVSQLAQARNASAGAVFTIETTPSAMRVSVYAGAVRLRNIRGKRKQTVNVKAGFQSLVNGARVPSKPRRFKPPKQPFWK